MQHAWAACPGFPMVSNTVAIMVTYCFSTPNSLHLCVVRNPLISATSCKLEAEGFLLPGSRKRGETKREDLAAKAYESLAHDCCCHPKGGPTSMASPRFAHGPKDLCWRPLTRPIGKGWFLNMLPPMPPTETSPLRGSELVPIWWRSVSK